ncbi:hypothetical protein SAMN05428642_101726 [Flaviramulus basaltis]|uniref:ATP synthase protein I n=1 Tax=Flaviramulus basaltis TaxID=369401 RepID=A0A1K2ICE6_9FLAO|nr:DUF6168 family protein [Flaviramulus basaltis]SFZ90073.1 hypothetical protein SAMN05428642_101726 [Flaviramulus basaltis]
MNKKLKTFLFVLIAFTLLLFSIQYFVIEHLKHIKTFFYNTWSIYCFHFFATLLIYLFVFFVQKTFSDKTGFAFIACSLLKMMASIVFLLPLILNKEQSALNDVIAFFIPYFLYLLFELIFIVKMLNNK